MPAIESRPYRVPLQRSVTVEVSCIRPLIEIDELPDVWESGQGLTLRVAAKLAPDFWEESGIPEDETVALVGVVTCLAARAKWRGTAPFVRSAEAWSAVVDIDVDGDAVAVETLVDVSVVGAGRTGHPDASRSLHQAARLWRLPAPVKVPLERLSEAFPTSAVSFAATGRRRVPWLVEVAHDVEPGWGLTSAMRLYVNTDLDVSEQILDGVAEQWVYQAIQADIYTAALFQLATVRDGYSSSAIADSAESDVTSYAAFCDHVAAVLGFDLEVALRLGREEPMQLIERAREASRFMVGED